MRDSKTFCEQLNLRFRVGFVNSLRQILQLRRLQRMWEKKIKFLRRKTSDKNFSNWINEQKTTTSEISSWFLSWSNYWMSFLLINFLLMKMFSCASDEACRGGKSIAEERTWAIYLIKQVVPMMTLAAAVASFLSSCPQLALIKISFANFSIYLAQQKRQKHPKTFFPPLPALVSYK